jgi:hypothetical protein
MNRLCMPVKLTLLALCLMVPLVLAMILLVRYLAGEVQLAQRALVGVHAAGALYGLGEQVRGERPALPPCLSLIRRRRWCPPLELVDTYAPQPCSPSTAQCGIQGSGRGLLQRAWRVHRICGAFT